MLFSNFFEAGQKLAQKLLIDLNLTVNDSWLVLAVSSNGIQIGIPIAQNLKISLIKKSDLVNGFDLKDKTLILTDDGVATGSTMQAVIEKIRQSNPKKIIVAIPVIAKEALSKVEGLADEVVYLEAPELFFNVKQFYQKY